MVICHDCGHVNAADSNFCSSCGERMRASEHSGDTTSMIPIVVDDNADAGINALDEAAINELLPGTALLIVRRGNSSAQRFLVNEASTVAGRSPEADIFLDDVTVSRKHAEFLIGAEGLIVRDLGSLNGTYINRNLVEGQSQLHTGDEVQIGKYKMVCFVNFRGLS